MPTYLFLNEITGETKEVILGINEKKECFDEFGNKLQRLWTAPNAASDTKLDPHDSKAFARATGTKKGTLGDLWDTSRDLSDKRAKATGKDPVKEKYLNDYEKVRNGAVHPSRIDPNKTHEI